MSTLLPSGTAKTELAKIYPHTDDSYSWGLRPEQDYLMTAPHPEEAQAIETLNVWFYDAKQNLGVNIHPQRILNGQILAIMVTVFLPDGRILRSNGDEAVQFTDPKRPQSKHVRFYCEKPFHQWTYSLDNLPMWETNKQELEAGAVAEKPAITHVSLELNGLMQSPIYMQGGLLPEAAEAIKGEAGLWFAARFEKGISSEAFRFEQIFSATGSLNVSGKTYPLEGCGLRGHVRGTRILGGMYGHTWTGGMFANGTAFGVQIFPRPEGGFFFSEAYIYKNGVMYPNRVVYAPPMSCDPNQGDYVIELACDELGLSRIIGRDQQVFWWSLSQWGSDQPIRWGIDPQASTVMRQATAEFRFDGEVGYGMCERSGPLIKGNA